MSRKIGELLVGAGFITQEQLTHALHLSTRARMRLGQALVVSGAISSDKLYETLAVQRGLPFVDLDACADNTRHLLELVPPTLLKRHKVVPVGIVTRKNITTLFLATSDPTDELALREIEDATRLRVRPVVAPPEAIRRALKSVSTKDFELDVVV